MQKIALLVLFFILGTTAHAQYGGYGNNRQRNYNEMNTRQNQPSKREIEKSKEEFVQKSMEKLTKDLSLDELQIIVIKKIIIEDQKARGIIIAKQDLSEEDKFKELEALNDNTNRQINSYLNPKQQETYKLLR